MGTVLKRVIIGASLLEKGTFMQSLMGDEDPLPSISEVHAWLSV